MFIMVLLARREWANKLRMRIVGDRGILIKGNRCVNGGRTRRKIAYILNGVDRDKSIRIRI